MSVKSVTVASPHLPLPALDFESGNMGIVKNMKIESPLDPSKLIGELHRNLPPPSLLYPFLKVLKSLSDCVQTAGAAPITVLMGKKAAGKTSSLELASYLVNGKTATVFDCSRRSLDELMWEPIIADSSLSLIARLEERFNSGRMNPINVTYLKAEIPEAFVLEAPEVEGETPEEAMTEAALMQAGMVPKSVKTKLDVARVGPDKIQRAIGVLDSVLKLEGIATINGIDISYREGIIIREWKAAMEAENNGGFYPSSIIADEVDKRLKNSGTSLQQFLLLMEGHPDRETVTTTKNGMSFTFNRREMPKGFSILMTGNDASDMGGDGQSGFNESTTTRLTIIPVEDASLEDFTHRICQWLAGIPFTLLEVLHPNQREKGGAILQELRTLGTEEPLDEDTVWMLKNHQKTLAAARQLASFHHKLAILLDFANTSLNDEYLEGTEGYREPPNIRSARKAITRGLTGDYLEVSLGTAEDHPNPIKSILEQDHNTGDLPPHIGERLCRANMEYIATVTKRVSPETRGKILEMAKQHGLIPEMAEEENLTPGFQSISTLLNNHEQNFDTKMAEAIQANLYKEIIKSWKGQTTPSANELIPLRDLQSALNQIEEKKGYKSTNRTTYILNINPDFLEGNRLHRAVECIPVLSPNSKEHQDKLREISVDGTDKEKVYEAMMPTETLLAVIKSAEVGMDAIDAFWNVEWQKELEAKINGDGTKTTDIPDCIRMADGSSNRLRISKVLTRSKKGTPEASLILHSQEKNNVWIISESGAEETILWEKGKTKGETKLFGPKDVKKLVLSLETECGLDIEDDLKSALAAFHWVATDQTDITLEEAIKNAFLPDDDEKAKKHRRIGNSKIPLRLSEDHTVGLG